MSKLTNEFNNMKNDLQNGISKVGKAIMHTASDLKADAQGTLHTMNNKRDELMNKYDDNTIGKKMEQQMKKMKK